MFSTFGGNSIQPGQVSYSSLSISANATLVWPDFETDSQQNVVSLIMDISASVAALSVTMPDATQTGKGSTVLIRNTGAQTFTVKDAQGNTIGSIATGIVKFIYLTDNATVGGTWAIFTFGTGTSAADAAALAGLGLQAIAATLAQSTPYTPKTTDWTIDANSLAQFYTATGGSVACNLPTSASLGPNFFFFLKNGGTGTVTLTPSGVDTVDGAATVALAPNDACIVHSGNTDNKWWTIGLGRSVSFAFTQLVKNVAGGVDVTLTSTEAANKMITFTGILTANINVIVPNTASVYYVYNNTSGAFTLTVKTAAGTGVAVAQGTRDILVCDATNVLQAQTNTASSAAFAVGSAGAPSITFIGDTDTGFYHPAADQVGVTLGGTLRTLFTTTGIDSQALRLKNVGAATAASDAPIVSQVQNQSFVTCNVVAGTANAITATTNSVAPAAYVQGQVTRLIATLNNTAAATIDRDGLGAKSILLNGFPLIGGEIRKNCVLELFYDGTSQHLLSVTSTIPSAGQFAVHELATPALSVLVDAGRMNAANALVSQAQQTVAGFTASGSNTRIDRVVLDIVTGAASRVAGTDAASPVAPAIPAGKKSLAQIGPFGVATASITNSMITDEREVFTDYMFSSPSLLNLLLFG